MPAGDPVVDAITLIDSVNAHYVIFGCSIFAILWGALNALWVSQVEIHAEHVRPGEEPEDEELKSIMPTTPEGCLEKMVEVNKAVSEGAITFLNREYCYLTIFIVFFGALICCVVDVPWDSDNKFPFTMVAFFVGAFNSMLAGYIGMKIATACNYKTTYLCNIDIDAGFKVAYRGGQVLGFVLVGLALLILEILIFAYRPYVIGDAKFNEPGANYKVVLMFEMISGYGLGGSTVALFGRVGGGIYTKAADVGADLAGKVGCDIPEDSPMNPGTIADNVGDNVGDIAGMGADLFGSLAESTCAALIVSATSVEMIKTPEAIYFPLLVTAAGIAVSWVTQFFAYIDGDVKVKLTLQLIISTVLMSAAVYPCTMILPDDLAIAFAGDTIHTTPM
jgi:K(+)-stimulated pyrophosphate-energized sodium pump